VRTYLEPSAPIAPQAILVDDPKLAMDLAVALCEKPRMSNLSHGLWGYHGETSGGEVTVQSLGIGGPSAAAVVSDLAQLGVVRAVRVGSCIALEPEREPGARVLATEFLAADGTGSALAQGRRLEPDPALTEALASACEPDARGTVRSADVVAAAAAQASGAVALDQASAAFAAACEAGEIASAAALVVARSAAGDALGRAELDGALIELGTRALGAFGALAQAPGA
jgi:uridine phosphorylase